MLFVYITFPNRKEAREVGRTIVDEGLARCVNIIPGMESISIWKGKIEKKRECILVAKTSEKNYQRLERKVKELHSYELPCIVSFRAEGGSREFIRWVESGEE